MARHGKRVPWWRLRRAYHDLARDYQKLARMYREMQTEHAAYLAEAVSPGPGPGQTTWGWAAGLAASEADTQPVPPLDPDKATALVRNAGLLEQPGFSRVRNGHTPI